MRIIGRKNGQKLMDAALVEGWSKGEDGRGKTLTGNSPAAAQEPVHIWTSTVAPPAIELKGEPADVKGKEKSRLREQPGQDPGPRAA